MSAERSQVRTFTDQTGLQWEATIGRESWGTFVILFSRAGEVRQTVLTSESMLDAEQELDALSDKELRNLLAESQPWSGG